MRDKGRYILFERSAMTTKMKRVLGQALQLPENERARLVEQLANSLDEQKWLDELDRRADELRDGKVKGIPLAEALAQLGKRANGVSRKRGVSPARPRGSR